MVDKYNEKQKYFLTFKMVFLYETQSSADIVVL